MAGTARAGGAGALADRLAGRGGVDGGGRRGGWGRDGPGSGRRLTRIAEHPLNWTRPRPARGRRGAAGRTSTTLSPTPSAGRGNGPTPPRLTPTGQQLYRIWPHILPQNPDGDKNDSNFLTPCAPCGQAGKGLLLLLLPQPGWLIAWPKLPHCRRSGRPRPAPRHSSASYPAVITRGLSSRKHSARPRVAGPQQLLPVSPRVKISSVPTH